MATTFTTTGPRWPTKSMLNDVGTHQFAICDNFSQNYCADMVIKPLPFTALQFLAYDATKLASMASGTCNVAEVNTTGLGGITLSSTTKSTIAWSFIAPWDMDPVKEFAIRFEFGVPRACTKASDIITTVSYIKLWDLSTTTGAAPTVVMSDTTNTTSLNSSKAYGRLWSAWDSMTDSAVLALALVPGDDRLLGKTVFTLPTNTTATKVIGMQLGYYKRLQM
jgi:hypothetical protein